MAHKAWARLTSPTHYLYFEFTQQKIFLSSFGLIININLVQRIFVHDRNLIIVVPFFSPWNSVLWPHWMIIKLPKLTNESSNFEKCISKGIPAHCFWKDARYSSSSGSQFNWKVLITQLIFNRSNIDSITIQCAQ